MRLIRVPSVPFVPGVPSVLPKQKSPPPPCAGCIAPVSRAALANACRLWQTSEAQLSHRSRKGGAKHPFLGRLSLRVPPVANKRSAVEPPIQKRGAKRTTLGRLSFALLTCRHARQYCRCSSDFCAVRKAHFSRAFQLRYCSLKACGKQAKRS